MITTPQDLVDQALDAASGDACTVLLHESSSANLRWADNTLTTNGVMSSRRMTVVAQVAKSAGMAAGVVTGPVATRADVVALVERAEADAVAAAPAPDAQPAPTPGAEGGPGDDAEDWSTPPGLTGIEAFDGFAPALGEMLRSARSADRRLYGYAEHAVDTTYLGSTTGLRLRHELPAGYVSITGKPADLSTSVWVGQAADDFADVDVQNLDTELGRRLGWAARRVDLPAGRYETLLPPAAVADLLVYMHFVASGRDAFEGRTVFSVPGGGTKVGQRIVRPGVRLCSDPAYPGLGGSPFVATSAGDSSASVFDNGLPIGGVDWISDGVLTALATSRHTAELTGLPFQPFTDNLALEVGPRGAATDIDDLVAGTERGLLLTCLWYIRAVDPQQLLLTGLTRDGTYLVEGGEVVGVANNFRFNESPISLLERFTEAGSTVRSWSREWGEFFNRTATPPLRIPDFMMSSVSPAT